MKKSEFKKGLNSELKLAGFTNRIERITETPTFETTLVFKSPIDRALLDWLIKRFKNGITVSTNSYGNVAFINHPKKDKITEKIEEEIKKWEDLVKINAEEKDFHSASHGKAVIMGLEKALKIVIDNQKK